MRTSRILYLLVALFFWNRATAVFAAKDDLVLRSIPPKLGDAFCAGDFSFQTMWSVGMYDAQVEGVILRDKEGKKVSIEDRVKRAKELATETHKLGYASGECKDGSAWAVAIPSPVEIQLEKRVLSLERYTPFCKDGVKVYWVGAEKGEASKLISSKGGYHLPNLNGYVSVICNNAADGPQEVYLAPSGSFPVELPVTKSRSLKNDDDIVLWINSIRKGAAKPLVISSELNKVSANLSIQERVNHDMKAIKSEVEKLGKLWNFVGEDRVRARTIDEAVLLLWISPLHRKLLMDGYATHLGLTLKKDKDVFLQLTLAREIRK